MKLRELRRLVMNVDLGVGRVDVYTADRLCKPVGTPGVDGPGAYVILGRLGPVKDRVLYVGQSSGVLCRARQHVSSIRHWSSRSAAWIRRCAGVNDVDPTIRMRAFSFVIARVAFGFPSGYEESCLEPLLIRALNPEGNVDQGEVLDQVDLLRSHLLYVEMHPRERRAMQEHLLAFEEARGLV